MAQVDDQDEQVGYGTGDQMVVKAALNSFPKQRFITRLECRTRSAVWCVLDLLVVSEVAASRCSQSLVLEACSNLAVNVVEKVGGIWPSKTLPPRCQSRVTKPTPLSY